MFEHVSVFLSFVYAMGLTHLLESFTKLLNARKRVKWSGLHLAWMLAISLSLFVNWFGLFRLHDVTSWPLHVVLVLFAQGLAQYFACSFVSIGVDDNGQIDMPALYEHQRELFLAAGILISLFGIIRVWSGSAVSPTTTGSFLTIGTLFNAGGILTRLVAMFARSRVVQWIAVIAQFALLGGFLGLYWGI